MDRSGSRFLFASTHCLIDSSSGAAIATGDALKLLVQRGFVCRVFCAAKLDLEAHEGFEQILADIGLRAHLRALPVGNRSVRLLSVPKGGIPVCIFRTRSTQIHQWSSGEPETMLAALERIATDFRPDVLLTYGGDPVTQTMIRVARQRGIPVVFALHNFAYHDAAMFRGLGRVIVPSEFSRRWYEQKLGLRCHVLPYAIDWERISCQLSAVSSQPEDAIGDRSSLIGTASDAQHSTLNPQRFVTFVNPQPAKGVFVFARIAEQLQRRRPDIPILVIESRGAASWLERTGVDLSWAPNLHAMANTHDPRDFYAVTKILLMPSLWNESFGLAAAEAMINGIPVLASDRGALPETLGREQKPECSEPEWCASGGALFHISDRYTPETTVSLTADEVEPWVQTLIKLWDNRELYRECSEKAIAYSQRWHPDRLAPMYVEFFGSVRTRR